MSTRCVSALEVVLTDVAAVVGSTTADDTVNASPASTGSETVINGFKNQSSFISLYL